MVMTLGSDGQPTGVAASLWLRPDAAGNLPTVPEGWPTVLQLAQKRAFYETYPQFIAPSTSYSQPSTGLHLGVSRESKDWPTESTTCSCNQSCEPDRR
jgi:hypothetical protein